MSRPIPIEGNSLFTQMGHPKVSGTHVSIFLWNQVAVELELQYTLFVVSQLEPIWRQGCCAVYGRVSHFPTSSVPTSRGWEKFITLADLETEGYLIGDCCMIGVEFHIAPAKSGTAECFSLIEKPPKHKVTWMMTKFSSFDPKSVHHSDEFPVGNRKWRIKVHPRGFMGEKDKSFSVFLSTGGYIDDSPKTKTYAKFKLRVLDQGPVSRNHVEKTISHWFGEKLEESHGFTDFMPLGKLNEPYLVKDKLYVGVEFEVISITNYC